ncbi:MAG: hypothetical protein DRP85_09185, partial [Candidatus Makaraimicrobium thalassicum]
VLGRFISADTIVPSPGDPQSLNRYSYVRNSPMSFIDPSGHDPLDPAWVDEFTGYFGYEPDGVDRLIRLYSIAFPDEWDWNKFYNAETRTRHSLDEIEAIFVKPPASRNWAGMHDALTRLTSWYNTNETEAFVRDIGDLFGGLPGRFGYPSTNIAVTGCSTGMSCDDRLPMPSHFWARLNPEGMSHYLTGTDDDANVHHWAWAFVAGYHYGHWGAVVNTGREVTQNPWSVVASVFVNRDFMADVYLGNHGARMGAHLKGAGISPLTISFLWNDEMWGTERFW